MAIFHVIIGRLFFRRRRDSSSPRRRRSSRRRHSPVEHDNLSKLPQDILIKIISLLPLKEAGRTSVLSLSWKNLWKFTPFLNFEVDRTLLNRYLSGESWKRVDWRSELESKCVNWVNSVVESHEAPVLNEFSIRLPLDNRYQRSITRWVRFAFARRVQRLELDCPNREFLNSYRFSREAFAESRVAPKLYFESLRELTIKNVLVMPNIVELCLERCRFLEKLTILRVMMPRLEIFGASLKWFEFVCFPGFQTTLKLSSAPNLTFFKTTTPDFLLVNVPKLVDISLCCADDDTSLQSLFHKLSSSFSKVECLHLKLRASPLEVYDGAIEFDELSTLKKLSVEFIGRGDESLARVAALVTACPYLEEFIFEYKWHQRPQFQQPIVMDVVESPHHSLKIFTFTGFYGRSSDNNLIKFILNNCHVLSKVIIDPRREQRPEVEENARENAKKLKVPDHIDFTIL